MSSDLLETLGLSQDELRALAIERIVERLTFDDAGELTDKLEQLARERADETVKRFADEHILPRVGEFIENLVLQETNRYGEKKGKPATFIEYLVGRADAYMGEKVDFHGKSASEDRGSFWKGTQTRLTHMIHEHLHYSIDTAMKQALDVATKSIGRDIAETAKIKLAEISAKLKVEVKTK